MPAVVAVTYASVPVARFTCSMSVLVAVDGLAVVTKSVGAAPGCAFAIVYVYDAPGGRCAANPVAPLATAVPFVDGVTIATSGPPIASAEMSESPLLWILCGVKLTASICTTA